VVKATKAALGKLDVLSPKLKRCTECRWLDIIVIDGKRFGTDAAYTKKLRMAQPDPWFFVNISRDLKQFDEGTGNFRPANRSPFKELRACLADLAKLGFA
jgi:hypothetical protein